MTSITSQPATATGATADQSDGYSQKHPQIATAIANHATACAQIAAADQLIHALSHSRLRKSQLHRLGLDEAIRIARMQRTRWICQRNDSFEAASEALAEVTRMISRQSFAYSRSLLERDATHDIHDTRPVR